MTLLETVNTSGLAGGVTFFGLLSLTLIGLILFLITCAWLSSWYERLYLFFEYGAHSERIRLNEIDKKLQEKQNIRRKSCQK